MALIALLKTIPDPRGHRGRRHQLWVLLCLSLLGSLCGYRGYRPLADFARKHHQSWCELLNLEVETTQCPSYSTFRQLFLRVDAQAWVDVFNDWALHHLPDCWGLLAIDGKSIRCTRSGCSQTGYNYANIVSVYSHSAGVVQLALIFNKQASEIPAARQLVTTVTTAAPKLASAAPLCFSLDALHTQVETLAQIHRQGAHYIVGVKANQKTLYQRAQQIAQQSPPLSVDVQVENTRARQVRREVALYQPTQLPERWSTCSIQSIIGVKRTGTRQGKPFCEQHYYLSNRRETAAEFAAFIRAHWQIENGLHWVKDVTLKEDYPDRVGGQSPISWAILNSFLITFARRLAVRTLPQATRELANQVHQVFRWLT